MTNSGKLNNCNTRGKGIKVGWFGDRMESEHGGVVIGVVVKPYRDNHSRF